MVPWLLYVPGIFEKAQEDRCKHVFLNSKLRTGLL
jgi:hypothetical protein